jgi:lipopolysaccharide heptosyltransferase II
MKLLIRATNWVGDAIIALPALRVVREHFKDAQITILARPYVADLYRDQRVCDDLIAYDWAGGHAGFTGRRRLVDELRKRKFDTALLLQNAFDAAWLTWRAGIPERIGYARDGRSWLLTKAVEVPRAGEIPAHEMFYYLELLRRIGWLKQLPRDERVAFEVPEVRRRRGAELLLEAGARPHARRIALGAGASFGAARCWPAERFAEAANRLAAEADADVVLIGTAGEAAVNGAIATRLKRPAIDLTGKTVIAELPGVLSQCHVFIGNDSGVMHVAAAVSLPVVGIFGPTDPLGTAPLALKRAIVQQKPYCSPCFLRRCPTDHRCMTRIVPEMVEAAAKPWLAAAEHPTWL